MSDCIFCKIVNGEIPCYKLYEDEYFIVILDRFPSNLGHTLIITKKHYANIFELDKEVSEKLFPLAVDVSNAIKDALSVDQLNFLQNNGSLAGQSVHHFHMHIIPRYKDDNVAIKWSMLDPTNTEFENIMGKIKINR